MNSFQAKLLDMLKWFHSFCIDNDLRYYALGGTMLGAVRHQGFIPWDDDLDVGMPRKDYEKLEALMNNHEDETYILETANTQNSDYCYPYSKLFDKTTTLIENQKYKIKRGLYIDIFPLDGLGNTIDEARENYRQVERKRNLLLLKTSGIRKGRKLYKNILVLIAKLIPLNEIKLRILVSKVGNFLDFNEAQYGGNSLGAWRFKEIMPICYMGEPKLYKFEDTEIYGAECAAEYLTSVYGDWKKLPSKEKQVTHHSFLLCDLNKSWLEE